MTEAIDIEPLSDRELTLGRIIAAPRRAVWRCWTEPQLLKQWYCPKPWYVSEARLDIRTHGASFIVMNGPNGERQEWPGLYLDVVPDEKLVFTDAFSSAWVPSGQPFMVGIVEFADHAKGTLYTARVRHWTMENRDAHLAMGFHEGWGATAQQLEELARSIA